MQREWQHILYDALAARCEAGAPDLAKDYLANAWQDSKRVWGNTRHFRHISQQLHRVGNQIKRDYGLKFEL